MKLSTLAVYGFWLLATAFLALLETRTDDAGVVAVLVLGITFLLGCLHPRRAWQWALLVGPVVPAVHLGSGTMQFRDMALLTAFVVTLGFAGSYAGVAARKVIAATA